MRIKILAVLRTAIFVAVMSGCKKPTDGVTVTVNTDIYSAPVLVKFSNANSSSPTIPDNFDVTVTGQDAGLITTSEGKRTFKVVGGMLALVHPKSVKASVDKPLKFSIIASAGGFAPSGRSFVITEDSISSTTVKMVEYANPPEGTAVLNRQITVTSGASPAATLLVAAASSLPATEIKMQEGTRFLDENGNQISGATLDTKIVYYGNATQAARDLTPGGYTGTDVLDIDGQPIQGISTFIPAGVLSVNMKLGNTEVKNFSKPLQVIMFLRDGLSNPATGQAVKAGDQIPVWSINEKTGQRKMEDNGNVITENGKLAIRFQVTHLSEWGSWWFWGKSKGSDVANILMCNRDSASELNVYIRYAPGMPFWGTVNLDASDGQTFTDEKQRLIYMGGVYKFKGAFPAYPTMRVTIRHYTQGEIFISEKFNPCDKKLVEIDIPDGRIFPMEIMCIRLKAICANKKIEANLTAPFKLKTKIDGKWSEGVEGYIKDGEAGFSGMPFYVKSYNEYRLELMYGGKMYSKEFTLEPRNFEFGSSNDLGSIKGKMEYYTGSSTYWLTGQVALNCD